MRKIITLDTGWLFSTCEPDGNHIPVAKEWQSVRLPHVWNKENANEMGPRLYHFNLKLEQSSEENQYYLDFGAVAGACTVWLNGAELGHHRGGYARFRFSLRDAAHSGDNELIVLADNTRYQDIAPLGGDFNNYGGIYRPVQLICVNRAHFDLLYYGTTGLRVKPNTDGSVQVESRLTGIRPGMQVKYTIWNGPVIEAEAILPAEDCTAILKVQNPHLWNGKEDPHLYSCSAQLIADQVCIDEVSLNFGFRSIKMSPDTGFVLNGNHMSINGVAKHQDFEGVGCATSKEQLDEDMALIMELGANAVRLSHYQHPDYFYDLCDRNGLMVWAEIPMLGMPDGNDGVMENAKQQMKELILQCMHHPSIICWGIQNEIAMMGESLEMYRKTEALNALVHELDSTRLTAGANLYCVKNNSQLNYITDMVGYNIYFGWYYDEMVDFKVFFDKFREDNPQVSLGVSEYGVDCSVTLHSSTPKRKDYSEEFQALYHETVYPIIKERKWLWGSFIWNMFDFGSAMRDEGGTKGKNCKGLVTFDRKVKKDSFYYYKAWWSDEPFVYLTGKRYEKHCEETMTVKVYSNLKEVSLQVNGCLFATLRGSKVFEFKDVPLLDGENKITALTGEYKDSMIIRRVAEPEQSYIYIDPNPGFNVKNWFTMELKEEDLFPENRYSIMDTIHTLSSNPEVWEFLNQEIPAITNNPRTMAMPAMTLLRIFNRMSGQFEEDFVKEINNKLNQIPKLDVPPM